MSRLIKGTLTIKAPFKHPLVAIFDMDGVLADMEWRQPRIAISQARDGEVDWDWFHSDMNEDLVNEKVHELAKIFHELDALVICTSRPERYSEVTIEWLKTSCGFLPGDYTLHMRADKNWEGSTEYKKRVAQYYLAAGYQIHLAVDDHGGVCDAYKELGILTLEVNRIEADDWIPEHTKEEISNV